MSTSSRPASLRALARVGALALGVLVVSAGAAWAQEAAAPAPAPSFTADAGLMFWQVKPDKTADFEYVVNKLKDALLKTEDAGRKQQAGGWRVYKVTEPAPGGNVFYLFVVEPAVKGADYTSTTILKILDDTYPSEAQDLYKKFSESMAGGRNVLNMQLLAKMAQ